LHWLGSPTISEEAILETSFKPNNSLPNKHWKDKFYFSGGWL
jgi:hypothetical protein